MENEVKKSTRPPVRTRLFAFAALTSFLSLLGYVGQQGYRAATDSFIAPIILSPDNDMVLANKLKLSELHVERAKTSAQIQALDADVAAAGQATARLKSLHALTRDALAWTSALNARQAYAGAAELKILDQQRRTLSELLSQQQTFTQQARLNMDAGLISKMDLAKEEQATGRWQVALIETERTQLQAQILVQQAALARKALDRTGPAMPEQLAQGEQMVRIELELMKLEAEQRSKSTEKKVLEEKLALIVELDGQLKARPIFRALDKSMDVAFVPYTQLEGLHQGAGVYDCVWGIFHCKPVGTVAELVPGEVILPDPWGNQSRGQYAVLELQERDSAKSKTLRVRGARTAPFERSSPSDAARLSVK